MLKLKGIAHATLAVTDLQRTKDFYEELFDTKFEQDNSNSFSLLKVGIPCWYVQWDEVDSEDRFNERRVGLDHIAFEVDTIEDLKNLEMRLSSMSINHAGIERFTGKYPYIAFRDPDNIQTEFFINQHIPEDYDKPR